MSNRIIVVGSINLDLVASVERMPRSGETITGQDFATYPGGKGANQAVAAGRLGGDVGMIGRLGDDVFAAQLRSSLQPDRVDIEFVESVPGPSGSAVILVTPEGHNSIVVIPGANAMLQPEDLARYEKELSTASIILAQLEVPLATVERLGEIAARSGVPLVLDPAPARELSERLLSSVTWLTPNESEAEQLLSYMGIQPHEPLRPEETAEHLLATGARNVILKLGADGVFLSGADVAPTHVPSFAVEPVDTTAAGDAFNGAFAYALSEKKSPSDAARFANAAAACSVTRAGAQPSMATLAEVEALLHRAR